MAKTKAKHEYRSVYIPEQDIGIDTKINTLAKKDQNIPKELREKKSSMVSFITVLLWKRYIYEQEHKGGENND